MDIRILPGNVANQIAAGEVVQRPSSVVKELMENALDAGATQIHVKIKDAGRTLIQVIDNGCGMTPDEAVLAFERHATSKIRSAEDLMNLHTFGFRGEALPSIAAVAQVVLKTKTADLELGCQVEFENSKNIAMEEIPTPVGCNFEVRNLFYNVPARRKFLKTDTVELRHITEEFLRIALTRFDVSFNLSHNDNELYILKGARSMKYRIQDIIGTVAVSDLLDINAESSVVKIRGYIGKPDKAKKTLGNQYFFVNGRYFRSSYLHKAVMKAYEHLIVEGVTPSYFLYFDVDANALDVNIHPTKTEIKFEDDSVIFQTLYACLRECLGKSSYSGQIDFDNPVEIPRVGTSFEEFKPVSEPSFESSYNPFDVDGFSNEPSWQNGFSNESSRQDFSYNEPSWQSMRGDSNFQSQYPSEKPQDYGKLFEAKELKQRPILIIHDKYLMTSSKSGVMIINIRRANERILYNNFLDKLSKNEHVSQQALFPVTVRVGVENVLLINEKASLLESLGFDISQFSNDSIVVNGVPEGFSAQEQYIEEMIFNVLLILNDGTHSLSEMMTANMAEKLSRIGSSNISAPKNTQEAQCLIDSLFACDNSDFTASGRKIITVMQIADIDKLF